MTYAALEHEGQQVARKASHGGKREGAGRPKSERDDVTVKMDRRVVARAQFVARLRGLTVAEFLTEIARPGVDREFAKESAKQGEGK
jgi:hypothetical protein